jgi:hypothetical protein
MTTVRFHLVNTTSVSNLVVVVEPVLAVVNPSSVVADWRVLAPAAGGSSSFGFEGAISAVVSAGANATPAGDVVLGSLLPVLSTANGGVTFGNAEPGDDLSVAAVRNDSSERRLLTVNWRVDRRRVLTQHGLNQQSVASLALTRALRFYTRDPAATLPPLPSPDFISPPTIYTIPDTATAVKVTWSRDTPAGADTFTFAAVT